MEKRRRLEAINGEFRLPEAIIQHIQSFLNGRQAARTSILSKSWYNAWLTRPSLDFDQYAFGIRGDEDGFWKFKTMQRYKESKLKIESFSLWMSSSTSFDNVQHNSFTLATELILKAMKLGAIDLNFELDFHNTTFTLPLEVLLSENLIRLSVSGCRIDLGADGKDSDSDGVRTMTRFLGSVIYGPINLYELHKLKCLLLSDVNIDSFVFCDLSSKFPCLKDLSLRYCNGYNCKELELSSSSLECISFKKNNISSVKFDIPSIRTFKLSGSSLQLPSLSFTRSSREWESDVSIIFLHRTTSWFLQLKKLLITLSPSKVSLSLRFGSIVDESVDFQGLPKPVVENLWIRGPSAVCSTILECLFRSCRPKFIYHHWLQNSCIVAKKKKKDFFESLLKSLVQGLSENRSIANQSSLSRSDLHGLEEVNVERFEKSLAEWRPLPLDTLLDALASQGKKREKVCFQLKWGSDSTPFK